MHRLQLTTMLALALLWIGSGPAAASDRNEDHHARIVRIAALLDLQGAQASLGRPAMNGFVLGLQQGSEHGPLPFAALVDTESAYWCRKAACRFSTGFPAVSSSLPAVAVERPDPGGCNSDLEDA